MQYMTKQDVTSLLAETNHSLTVDDVELINQLDEAAKVVVNGPKDKSESVYAFPLFYGGEAFFAPTIGKQLYWQEHIAEQLPEDWLTFAFLWLLTLPEVPQERGGEVIKAVKKWSRRCKLTIDDVNQIVSAYSQEHNESNDSAKYGEIIALLVREYGKDCNHWLNAPEHEITILLADWTRRQEAKAAAYRSSRAGSKNPVAPAPSPKFGAMKKYRQLKNGLRELWLKSE